MDRLTAIQVFVEVADRGSLTQAAEALDMSTAMVSRYLTAVEGWLGARLFHRTTRKVSLTDAGAAALPSCRQMLDIATDAQHLAAQRGREPAGVLRVTASGSFAEAQLTSALVDFQVRHPAVEIVLSAGDKTADLVGERIDLAVRITKTPDPSLIARPLARCRSVLCAAPAYLRQHGTPHAVSDLRHHRCVAHAFGIGKHYRFTRGQEVLDAPVTWSFHTNDTVVLRSAVLAGAGIALLPTYYVNEDVRTGRLVRLLDDHEPEVLGIYAVYLSRRHQPQALRLLVDFLAERFGGETAPWDEPSGS